MLVSSSDGFWRDGLVAAILLRALMILVVVRWKASRFRENVGGISMSFGECVLAKVGQSEFCHVSTSALSDVSLFSTLTISSIRDGFYWDI